MAGEIWGAAVRANSTVMYAAVQLSYTRSGTTDTVTIRVREWRTNIYSGNATSQSVNNSMVATVSGGKSQTITMLSGGTYTMPGSTVSQSTNPASVTKYVDTTSTFTVSHTAETVINVSVSGSFPIVTGLNFSGVTASITLPATSVNLATMVQKSDVTISGCTSNGAFNSSEVSVSTTVGKTGSSNVTYYYRVVPMDANGYLDFSTIYNVTTSYNTSTTSRTISIPNNVVLAARKINPASRAVNFQLQVSTGNTNYAPATTTTSIITLKLSDTYSQPYWTLYKGYYDYHSTYGNSVYIYADLHFSGTITSTSTTGLSILLNGVASLGSTDDYSVTLVDSHTMRFYFLFGQQTLNQINKYKVIWSDGATPYVSYFSFQNNTNPSMWVTSKEAHFWNFIEDGLGSLIQHGGHIHSGEFIEGDNNYIGATKAGFKKLCE